jgi:hypothetical protein
MNRSYILSALVIGIASLSVLSMQVGAVSDRAAAARENAGTRREEVKQSANTKLDETKKKVCEKRQAGITSMMNKMQTRGESQLAVFTKIADRTKAFYEQKQRTVENYDDLVAAVDEKKLAAELAVVAGDEAIADFSCDASDPTAMKDLFKAQLTDQIAALKAYKTAVKDLIVGVKSAQGQTSRSQTTETEPTTETESTGGAQQ